MAEALDGELLAVRQRLLHDTPFWAGGLSGGRPTSFEGCCTILNARRQPVKLKARPWQARTPETPKHVRPLDEVLEQARVARRPARVIILKARKLGFSTWVQAKFMQRVSQRPFEHALTVAHRTDSYLTLASMARLMWERLPADVELADLLGQGGRAAPFSIRPQMVNSGDTRSDAFMRLGSKARPAEASLYATLTAGSKGGGRSSTPSLLHLSEAAFYDDEGFLLGVLNAVPREPDTIVVIESTANGFNHFHERWQRAVDGEEDELAGGTFTPLFYGWQDNPYNASAFLSPEARERFERTIGDVDGGGDEEEILLVEEFGVTFEQLKWRREVMADECNGKLDLFHQEHPATPEQAFIGSGQPVFPGILVAKMIRTAEKADEPVQGVIRGTQWETRKTRAGTIEIPTKTIWVPSGDLTADDERIWGDSRLLVWEHPRPDDADDPEVEGVYVGHRRNEAAAVLAAREQREAAQRVGPGQYVAFADVSTGQGNTLNPGDWHAIQVLDHVTRMQVARYRSRVPLADLPLICVLIGTYYNTAHFAPEVNSVGQGVLDAMKDYRYRRLYRRQREGDDQRNDQREYLLGWLTTMKSKPLMEVTFGQVLKENETGLRDVATGREFTTYVEDEKNPAKHGAQKGSHDDLVMAYMGVVRLAAELRPRDLAGTKTRSVRGRRKHRDPLTDY